MTNLDSIFKNRDITLLTKVCLVKAVVFPLVMYGYESWTVKKAEHRRIDGFELWCWRRLLRVPWTARRSNQSILKEISPGCSNSNSSLESSRLLFTVHRVTSELQKKKNSLFKLGCHNWTESIRMFFPCIWVFIFLGVKEKSKNVLCENYMKFKFQLP